MPREVQRLAISLEVKQQISSFLLRNCSNGKINRGAWQEALLKFPCSYATVKRIWSETREMLAEDKPVLFINKRNRVIHKDRHTLDPDMVNIVNMKDRKNIRRMAQKLGISKTLLHKHIKQGLLRSHSNAIKPFLTDANKLARIRFCLSQLNVETSDNDEISFNNMYNTIHIDEKWFYLTKDADKYYLLPAEEEPYRLCKSKRFIPKVMFMCAVARPQKGQGDEPDFDGKIGIFPFITKEAAQRGSKNRPRGTLETKPMQSICKQEIKECLINQIIPAIKEKWPKWGSKQIIIQQDNAKPHIKPDDLDFLNAANSDGFQMSLMCQPSNSPDTNINDLGFFRAIQSLQYVKAASNVDDLLANVRESFEELTATTLNNVFLTLQGCFVEIMTSKGGNKYKIPHMSKGWLIREGLLPECIAVKKDLVRATLEYLQLPENSVGNSYNISPVQALMVRKWELF